MSGRNSRSGGLLLFALLSRSVTLLLSDEMARSVLTLLSLKLAYPFVAVTGTVSNGQFGTWISSAWPRISSTYGFGGSFPCAS